MRRGGVPLRLFQISQTTVNNPLYDPEQLEYRPRLLDPAYDDVPEELPVYRFVPLDGGAPFIVYGQDQRDEAYRDLTDDGVPFAVEFTGEYGFDPDAII